MVSLCDSSLQTRGIPQLMQMRLGSQTVKLVNPGGLDKKGSGHLHLSVAVVWRVPGAFRSGGAGAINSLPSRHLKQRTKHRRAPRVTSPQQQKKERKKKKKTETGLTARGPLIVLLWFLQLFLNTVYKMMQSNQLAYWIYIVTLVFAFISTSH